MGSVLGLVLSVVGEDISKFKKLVSSPFIHLKQWNVLYQKNGFMNIEEYFTSINNVDFCLKSFSGYIDEYFRGILFCMVRFISYGLLIS